MSASIDQVLHGAVERGDAPFVVAMAADRDGVIYEGAAGRRRVDSDDPVTADSMLRIASMGERNNLHSHENQNAGFAE